MKHSTPPPNAADQERFRYIQDIGCIPCTIDGHLNVPCHVHHVIDPKTGKRMGHQFTYGNCPWHHEGQRTGGLEAAPMKVLDEMKPSLARNPARYHERYGSEVFLLELQNELIALRKKQESYANV